MDAEVGRESGVAAGAAIVERFLLSRRQLHRRSDRLPHKADHGPGVWRQFHVVGGHDGERGRPDHASARTRQSDAVSDVALASIDLCIRNCTSTDPDDGRFNGIETMPESVVTPSTATRLSGPTSSSSQPGMPISRVDTIVPRIV